MSAGCVLWDWNGTLHDDVEAAVAGTNALLRHQGKRGLSLDEYRAVFSFPARGCYEALGIDATDENWTLLCDLFFKAFAAHPSKRLFPGATGALRALRDAGFVQAIVSSSEISALEKALSAYGIREFFAEVAGKPDAAAGSKIDAAVALGRSLKLDPERTWVVGDTGHDKEVADALGCNCILLATGYESEARLRARGAAVAHSIDEVPALVARR
ncbi:MAG: HAD family hydrolase [Kiritimatiellae bacterium]|nr:HAD family hydrolase [Kiritimatiellia bacterium]